MNRTDRKIALNNAISSAHETLFYTEQPNRHNRFSDPGTPWDAALAEHALRSHQLPVRLTNPLSALVYFQREGHTTNDPTPGGLVFLSTPSNSRAPRVGIITPGNKFIAPQYPSITPSQPAKRTDADPNLLRVLEADIPVAHVLAYVNPYLPRKRTYLPIPPTSQPIAPSDFRLGKQHRHVPRLNLALSRWVDTGNPNPLHNVYTSKTASALNAFQLLNALPVSSTPTHQDLFFLGLAKLDAR